MDDNHVPSLRESQHEWAVRLMRIILPHMNDGIYAMFKESQEICKKADENEKYLMTFQNILSRVPKWNNEIIQKEVIRIVEKSGCSYIEDLITCVHIAHLKILTSIRTGKTQKKVDINIPKMGDFIHRAYVAIARELYSNVYLFDTSVVSLMIQQNKNKVLEIIQTGILNTIRDSIPVDQLLKAYLDETTDLIKEKEVKEEKSKELRFSDKDLALTVDNVVETIDAPKDIPTLEKISTERYLARKQEEKEEEDECKIQILDETIPLDIEDLTKPLVIGEIKKEETKLEDAPALSFEILS